ncbi:MAG: ParB N-terminal domain-containing protein [Sedimenticolaceae bacterium]
MELEIHQLDLRYQDLRRRDPKRERQLLASLAESGQQLPIVVVLAEAPIVIDGYKRVRALRRLARDTVEAMAWDVGEAEEARIGLAGGFNVARTDCQALFARFAQETGDAR